MVFWEGAHTLPNLRPVILEFARVWPRAEKVVYSKTPAEPRSARTRLERADAHGPSGEFRQTGLEGLRRYRLGNTLWQTEAAFFAQAAPYCFVLIAASSVSLPILLAYEKGRV